MDRRHCVDQVQDPWELSGASVPFCECDGSFNICLSQVYREVVAIEGPVGRGPSQHSTGRALAGDRSRPEDALGPLKEGGLWKKVVGHLAIQVITLSDR